MMRSHWQPIDSDAKFSSLRVPGDLCGLLQANDLANVVEIDLGRLLNETQVGHAAAHGGPITTSNRKPEVRKTFRTDDAATMTYQMMMRSSCGRYIGSPGSMSNASWKASILRIGSVPRIDAGAWGSVFTCVLRYSSRVFSRQSRAQAMKNCCSGVSAN